MASFSRYYRIAEITIEVRSDLPNTDETFNEKFENFKLEKPYHPDAVIHHHFDLLDISNQDLSQEVYRKQPWAIYQQPDGWLYLGIMNEEHNRDLWKIAQFNHDHTYGDIYHPSAKSFTRGNLGALTSFPTDQILIARLLADLDGFYFHSAGAILNSQGFLFVGHSEAGKTTTSQLLLDASRLSDETNCPSVELLCDDRNILRRFSDGWRLFGSWSHGDISLVSPSSAPLSAICFLEKSFQNRLERLTDRTEIIQRLLACVIKPLATKDWWHTTLDLIEDLSNYVPCYRMHFDKSGQIVNLLSALND